MPPLSPAHEITTAGAGYFGKLPAHGDFISNRIERSIRDSFDRWFREAAMSELSAREDWLEDGSRRLWRFMLPEGICGSKPLAGVMTLSADRVGRRYPLIIAASPGRLPSQPMVWNDWFARVERILRVAVAPGVTIADFDRATGDLGIPPVEAGAIPPSENGAPLCWWWCNDPADAFATQGLPLGEDFSRIFSAQEPTPGPASEHHVDQAGGHVRISVAAATHPGTRLRQSAADALASATSGVLAVADAVDEHPAAAQTARLALDGLRRMEGTMPWQDKVHAVRDVLEQADRSVRATLAVPQSEAAASVAVVVLCTDRLAVIWAGDARAYIMRHGMLRCLTSDHVEIGLRRAVARAVGRATALDVEVILEPVEPGDRLLLCNQGLLQALTEREIAELLARLSPQEAVETIVQDALIAGALQNLAVAAALVLPEGHDAR